MESSPPLTYLVQKALLSYLSFEKRQELAKNCQSLRKLNKIQGYRFDFVRIELIDEPDAPPSWLVELDEVETEFQETPSKDVDETAIYPVEKMKDFLKFYLDRKDTVVFHFHVQIRFEDWVNMMPLGMTLTVPFIKVIFVPSPYCAGLKALETMKIDELRVISEEEDDHAFEELKNLQLQLNTFSISTLLMEQKHLLHFAKNTELFRCIEYGGNMEDLDMMCDVFKARPVMNAMYSIGIEANEFEEHTENMKAKRFEWKGERIVTMKTCDPELELVLFKVTEGSVSAMVREAGFGESAFWASPMEHVLLLPFVSVFAVQAACQIFSLF